jgi:DNA polymerase I
MKILYRMTDEQLDALDPDTYGQLRRGAKNMVFGWIYERSDAGIASQLGVSVQEAAEHRERFFAAMPRVPAYINRQHDLVMREQEVCSIFGRKRRFPLILDRGHATAIQRQAVNMPIQSGVSDMTLLANLRILKRLRDEGIRVRPWPHIHDGFMLLVEEDRIDRGVEVLVEEMHDVGFETKVPFAIEAAVGPSWGSVKTVHEG